MDQINGRAVDLRGVAMPEKLAWEAQQALEFKTGKRCRGCGKRIGIGIRFTSFDVRSPHPIMQMAACSRPECDFAETARDGATCMEMFETVWLDDAGIEAEAMSEENMRRAAQL